MGDPWEYLTRWDLGGELWHIFERIHPLGEKMNPEIYIYHSVNYVILNSTAPIRIKTQIKLYQSKGLEKI
jgi:hypothetical protein